MSINKLADNITQGVSSRITSEKDALQFVLEELDAAREGNDVAKLFVRESGFNESEYEEAMQNSYESIDGVNGPQQYLLKSIFEFSDDVDFMVKLRIQVVKNIIDEWELKNNTEIRIDNLMNSLKNILIDDASVIPALTPNIPVPASAEMRHIHTRTENISSAKRKIATLSEFTKNDAEEIIIKSLQSDEINNSITKNYSVCETDLTVNKVAKLKKSTINEDDYETLKESPFIIFILMAFADGKVDQKETASLAKVIMNPSIFGSDFLVKIIQDSIPQLTFTAIPECLSAIIDNNPDYFKKLQEIRIVIDKNFEEDEANHFKKALIRVGYKIADASGGFFGLGSRVCKEEKQMLKTIAHILDVTI